MRIGFLVHNVSRTEEIRQVKIPDTEELVAAKVPCVEVELTTEDASHGSLTLRFMGEKAAEAEKAFVVDEVVYWDIPVPVEIAKAA